MIVFGFLTFPSSSVAMSNPRLSYRYVAYCMKFAHMLRAQGVRPILVFDGCTLPSKKDVERARRE